jgi:hypothetical protein
MRSAKGLPSDRFDCQLLTSGQVTHSPGRIGYASGKLPYNRHVGQVFRRPSGPLKTPYAAPNSVEERPPLISECHTNFQFRPQN